MSRNLSLLCKLALNACLFSILAPVCWWVLPAPQELWASWFVLAVAIMAGGSWIALALGALGLYFEEMATRSYYRAAREYMEHNAEWFQKRAEMDVRL